MLLGKLQDALLAKAEEYHDTIMPGFTHLQVAQPVTLGHHLLAYVEMLERDRTRARDCRARLNECPLGAAALAGTSFPIDRDMTAKELGFDRPAANSLDAEMRPQHHRSKKTDPAPATRLRINPRRASNDVVKRAPTNASATTTKDAARPTQT